jgi:hypothetical protein
MLRIHSTPPVEQRAFTRAYPEQPTASFATPTLVVHSVLIGNLKRIMRYVSVYYTRTRHPNTADVNLVVSA